MSKSAFRMVGDGYGAVEPSRHHLSPTGIDVTILVHHGGVSLFIQSLKELDFHDSQFVVGLVAVLGFEQVQFAGLRHCHLHYLVKGFL